MDKRIGWNLDSSEHAMFNWTRPIPACAKVRSQFDPTPVKLLETAYIIRDRILHMRASKRRSQCGIVILILLWATAIAPEPGRSEERRVGKECRYRMAQSQCKENR